MSETFININEIKNAEKELGVTATRLLWLLIADAQDAINEEYGDPSVLKIYLDELASAGYIDMDENYENVTLSLDIRTI